MTRRTAVIRLEGVIQTTHGGLVNPTGLILWKMLEDHANVYIVTNQDRIKAGRWLSMNVNLTPVTVLGPDQTMEQHVNFIVGAGSILEFVITPDPIEAQALIYQGHRVLAYLEPAYQAAEWRPGGVSGPRPWDEVSAEIIAQREERAADLRTIIEVERAD